MRRPVGDGHPVLSRRCFTPFKVTQGKVVVGVGTMVAVAGLRSRGDSGVVETAQSAEGDPMGTDGRAGEGTNAIGQ